MFPEMTVLWKSNAFWLLGLPVLINMPPPAAKGVPLLSVAWLFWTVLLVMVNVFPDAIAPFPTTMPPPDGLPPELVLPFAVLFWIVLLLM